MRTAVVTPPPTKPLFSLGQLVATPGALEALATVGRTPLEFLARHATGDWGELCAEDREANHEALKQGTRIFSSYQVTPDLKVWVITEADRSVTTILLPDEY